MKKSLFLFFTTLLCLMSIGTKADTPTTVTIGGVKFAVDENGYYTSEGHVAYTYYSDKTCAHSAKDASGNYIAGQIPWVKTVTITGLNFEELKDGSGDMNKLQTLIMNGRRTDTSDQFKDAIEVSFVN